MLNDHQSDLTVFLLTDQVFYSLRWAWLYIDQDELFQLLLLEFLVSPGCSFHFVEVSFTDGQEVSSQLY